MENAVYSVISPEGAASIIWKDAKKVREASQCLRLTADDLKRFGIVERVVPEKKEWRETFALLGAELAKTLEIYRAMPTDELLNNRYRKFRRIGGDVA